MMSGVSTIGARATARHDETCSRGWNCQNREWHIENDYLKREARDYIRELEEEVSTLKRLYGIQ